MTYIPAHPKPGQVRKKPEPVKIFPDGREKCNLNTTEGRRIYMSRKEMMWLRNDRKCCLFGKIPGFTGCLGNTPHRQGRVRLDETYFEHENGRGAGKQDDRISKPVKKKDGTVVIQPINGAACGPCNIEKGSRRIHYNPDILEAI